MTASGKRGRFIAFEGGEGAGKSTQAELLAEALTARGIEVDVTREPGGTPGAEAIRELLLNPPVDGDWTGWGGRAEALLFAAARSDHVANRIEPALAAGKWVICDRFVDSSRAYQGGAGAIGDEAIQALHQFGSDGLRPDKTILLEVAPDVLGERVAVRDGVERDAIGGRNSDYHRKVAARFSVIAQADPKGFLVVDGGGAAKYVHSAIMSALEPMISEFV